MYHGCTITGHRRSAHAAKNGASSMSPKSHRDEGGPAEDDAGGGGEGGVADDDVAGIAFPLSLLVQQPLLSVLALPVLPLPV